MHTYRSDTVVKRSVAILWRMTRNLIFPQNLVLLKHDLIESIHHIPETRVWFRMLFFFFWYEAIFVKNDRKCLADRSKSSLICSKICQGFIFD